ncbi:MAG: LTA synthase family protein [Lachnospiraceae bacterium]|nr:LTA synthase family protein [Lachnospiraceae bacterium]
MNKEKIKGILEYQIPPKVVNTVCLIILLCLSCLVFIWNAEAVPIWNGLLYVFLEWCGTSSFWYSLITLLILWGLFYCLTGKLLVSYVLMEILTVIWGFANRVVYYTRDQFVSVLEFKVLVEAAEVKVDINVGFHPIMVVLLVIWLILGILLWVVLSRIKKECTVVPQKKVVWGVRIGSCVVLVIAFVVLHYKPPMTLLNNMLPYKETGSVVWFCQSLFDNVTRKISEEEVLAIYDDFVEMGYVKEVHSEKRPNVIVIMSEAFWDVNNIKEVVEVNDNPMDKYFELTKGTISGQVAVNIYGGGTNNSEFEFLTGINSQYLMHSNCYKKYYTNEQGTMASYMKEIGYYTMAFHPYEGKFWGRDIAYPNMGFEVFYDDKLFLNREMSHGYISDMSLTREIIGRFEEQKAKQPDQPIFAFAVSVQNHISDLGKFDEDNANVDFAGIDTIVKDDMANDVNRADVEEYYNGLHETIEALEELLDYFEKYDEDTVVVFFGDHAPAFVRMICDTLGKETEYGMYRTPYMIWTNYVNDFEPRGDFNLSYLSSVLLEYLEFPKPKQYYVNKYMMKNCVINTRYEQNYSANMDSQKIVDMMNTVYYLCDTFPKKPMALPYWQIVE